MKTRIFACIYLVSAVALILAVTIIEFYETQVGALPSSILLGVSVGATMLISFLLVPVGMIGAIVSSKRRGKAAGAAFGVLIGIGLMVAGFFILRAQIQEGSSDDLGHMMAFGVLPIPLMILILLLPIGGAILSYNSIKTLLIDLPRQNKLLEKLNR